MKLMDIDTQEEYTLSALRKEWEELKEEDPHNHSDSFTCELFEILMATVNGRNDLEIVGLTPSETSNYILALRGKIEGRA